MLKANYGILSVRLLPTNCHVIARYLLLLSVAGVKLNFQGGGLHGTDIFN